MVMARRRQAGTFRVQCGYDHSYLFVNSFASDQSCDPSHSAVILGLAECWMSWNSDHRAVEWGHGAVHWLAEGTDG